MSELDLSEIREEIDRIDRQMIELFQQRLDCVCDVARYKHANGLPIFDETREKAVIAKRQAQVEPEIKAAVGQFMQAVMDTCKLVEADVIDQLEKSH
ncbi:MAG: chorismate mutase [Pseudoramibacter sp.]|jgi:chorismate mutase/prephenate dehydratase